jgi:hypothetical protein
MFGDAASVRPAMTLTSQLAVGFSRQPWTTAFLQEAHWRWAQASILAKVERKFAHWA